MPKEALSIARARNAEIFSVIKEYLDRNHKQFAVSEGRGENHVYINLCGRPFDIAITVSVGSEAGQVVVVADPAFKVHRDFKHSAAELITRINHARHFGVLKMNWSTGDIVAEANLCVMKSPLTSLQFEWAVHACYRLLNDAVPELYLLTGSIKQPWQAAKDLIKILETQRWDDNENFLYGS